VPDGQADPAAEFLRCIVVIATRCLTLRQSGSEIEVPIAIYAPELVDRSWVCKYEIGWPEGTKVKASWGADSLQAIVIALQMIGTDIYTSHYYQDGQLIFEKPGRGYGIPVPGNLRDLLVGDDAASF
jgi:hypothetical protein